MKYIILNNILNEWMKKMVMEIEFLILIHFAKTDFKKFQIINIKLILCKQNLLLPSSPW